MQEAPIQNDDRARLKELHSYGLLDTPPEAIFDDITHLVQDIAGTRIGIISLVDENRQWFKSCVGLEQAPSETPRNISFCGHTIVHRQPLIIEDALNDERFSDNPLVTGEPRIRFYAGFPLITANGLVLGSLCAIDQEPKTLTSQQITSLERLARQVVNLMELRRKALLLKQAEQALLGRSPSRQTPDDIQLLHEINPLMNREQLMEMLRLIFNLDQPPYFTLFRCKFKEYSRISVSLGTKAADSLVQSGLSRLRGCLPDQATLALFSDNEVVIVLPYLSEESSVTDIAECCISSLEDPAKLDGRDLELNLGIGIAIFKNNYTDPDSLLSDASIAQKMAVMDRGKSSGYRFIDLSSRLQMQQHYQIETDLRRTIRRNEITPYLQPIVNLATGQPIGLESLMRWQTDSKEVLPPSRFLPVSQLAGLSGELDLQILHKVLQASQELAAAVPKRPLLLSVNLSGQLLDNKSLRQRLLHELRSTPLPQGWRLQVELVEDNLQDQNSDLGDFLTTLSQQGVTIAIDDFGTGYSSLSRLHHYPVGALKVDSSFVQRINDPLNPSNQLLKTIQTLCTDLNLSTTAEGVETEEQRTWLLQNGYRQGQGFLFSPPMTVAATRDYLSQLA